MNMRWILVLVLAFFVSACSPFPDADLAKVKAFPGSVKAASERYASREKQWKDFEKHPDYKFLAPYAAKEAWGEMFVKAGKDLAEAKSLLDGEVAKIVKDDRKEDIQKLHAAVLRIDALLSSSDSAMKLPFDRMQILIDARKNAPTIFAKADADAKAVVQVSSALQIAVSEASKEFPDKAEDLSKRVAPSVYAAGVVVKEFTPTLAREYGAHTGGGAPQYDVFVKTANDISGALATTKKVDAETRKKMGELRTSYSKTLVDMRLDCTVTVTRTSWDEDEDWPTEHTHNYAPRKVTIEDCAYFSSIPEETVVFKFCKGWCSDGVYIDQSKWNLLNINPDENWYRFGEDMAEFEIDVDEKYYHRYLITENGKSRDGGWVQVDETLFDKHDGDLGMDILSKPYGVYEEEKITEAQPPGMSFVGNEKYGAWKSDGRGGSFWEFYGQYALIRDLLGSSSNSYSRHDWDHWRTESRGKKPYYGRDEDDDRYGSHGSISRTHPSYQGSTWAKSGGFKSTAESVRGAGPSARGGGPGGSGK